MKLCAGANCDVNVLLKKQKVFSWTAFGWDVKHAKNGNGWPTWRSPDFS